MDSGMKDQSYKSSASGSTADGQPLKIGIVGFGRLAQNYYAPALRQMERQLEICVADPLEGSRTAAARAFANVRTYSDYLQLLENEPLHAVLVATPPSEHLKIWHAISHCELPVFMEKPFLLSDELEQIDKSDPAWQKLMVNFNRRFWPAYRDLGKCVANGSLGQIEGASFVLNVNAQKWSKVSNHRVQTGEGGVLYDLGSQVLDLVLVTFCQKPAEIVAQRSGGGVFNERIDMKLSFPNGIIVDCNLAYGNRNRESVMIKGEKATLQLRDPNFLCWVERNPSIPGRLARSAADLAALGYRGIFRSQSMLRYSVSASLETFFETLGTSRPFSPGFKDALRVAQYTRAAAVSIARGQKQRIMTPVEN